MEPITYRENRTYELQKLDCNCSDCRFLERSLSKRQAHVDFHYRMQKDSFDTRRMKLLEKGERYLERARSEPKRQEEFKGKAKNVFNEARKMEFVFSEGTTSLFYGRCDRFDREISFIPNILQLATQECFVHRKD